MAVAPTMDALKNVEVITFPVGWCGGRVSMPGAVGSTLRDACRTPIDSLKFPHRTAFGEALRTGWVKLRCCSPKDCADFLTGIDKCEAGFVFNTATFVP
jgi:hypothetical protein